MDNITIQGGGASAVLHRQTNRSRIVFRRLYQVLLADNDSAKQDDDERSMRYLYAVFAAQSTDLTGVTFRFPGPGATAEQVNAAFETFMDDTNTAFTDALLEGVGKLTAPTVLEQAPGNVTQVEQTDPNLSSGGETGKGKRSSS